MAEPFRGCRRTSAHGCRMSGWSCLRLSVVALAVAIGCGGESRRSEPGTPTLAAEPVPTASSPPDAQPSAEPLPSAPSTASAPPAVSGCAPASSFPSDDAPPASPPDARPPPASCPDEIALDVDPRVPTTTVTDGITVEPLQLPDFSSCPFPAGLPVPTVSDDPADWDRSARPAGACVFRLHGLDAACFPDGGIFFVGSCASLLSGAPKIAPGSFYDVQRCGVAPGCPSSNPWTDGPGYWWYLVDRGPDTADLVICAPECQRSFATGGCLRMHPSSDSCP